MQYQLKHNILPKGSRVLFHMTIAHKGTDNGMEEKLQRMEESASLGLDQMVHETDEYQTAMYGLEESLCPLISTFRYKTEETDAGKDFFDWFVSVEMLEMKQEIEKFLNGKRFYMVYHDMTVSTTECSKQRYGHLHLLVGTSQHKELMEVEKKEFTDLRNKCDTAGWRLWYTKVCWLPGLMGYLTKHSGYKHVACNNAQLMILTQEAIKINQQKMGDELRRAAADW